MADRYASFRANEMGKASLRLTIEWAEETLAKIKISNTERPNTRRLKRTSEEIEQLKRTVSDVLAPFAWKIPARSILEFDEEQKSPGWAIRNALLVHDFHCRNEEGDTTITADVVDSLSNFDAAYHRFRKLIKAEGQKDVYLAALAISNAERDDAGSIISLRWSIDGLDGKLASISGRNNRRRRGAYSTLVHEYFYTSFFKGNNAIFLTKGKSGKEVMAAAAEIKNQYFSSIGPDGQERGFHIEFTNRYGRISWEIFDDEGNPVEEDTKDPDAFVDMINVIRKNLREKATRLQSSQVGA